MGREPVVGEGAVDGVGVGGDLEPGGGALAAGADGDVVEENVMQHPGPGLAARRLVGLGAARQRLLEGERIGLGLGRGGHDLGAELGSRRQDAVVAHHVHARRRDEGADAGQQIEGLELDGGGAVLPGALEAVADAAVVEVLEAFLGDGGTGQIAAEALDLGVVGAVEGAGGVDVEALDDGDGLVGAGLAGIDEAQGGLAGAGAEEAEALGRGGAETVQPVGSSRSWSSARRSSSRRTLAAVRRATSATSSADGGGSGWKVSSPSPPRR